LVTTQINLPQEAQGFLQNTKELLRNLPLLMFMVVSFYMLIVIIFSVGIVVKPIGYNPIYNT